MSDPTRWQHVEVPLAFGPCDAVAVCGASALYVVPTPEAAREVRRTLLQNSGVILGAVVVTPTMLAEAIVRPVDRRFQLQTPTLVRLAIEATLSDFSESEELKALRSLATSRGFVQTLEGHLSEVVAVGWSIESWAKQAKSHPDRRVVAAAKILPSVVKRLNAVGAIAEPDLLRRAAELWSAGHRGAFANLTQRTLAVVGFTRLESADALMIRTIAATAQEAKLFAPNFAKELELGSHVRQLLRSLGASSASLFSGPPSEILTVALPAQHHPARPVGVAKLADAIFRLSESRTSDTTGLKLLAAPGVVGEARMVARQICQEFNAGTPPERIVVVARRWGRVREVVREVFDDYSILHHGPEADPLSRTPAVAFLLKAWHLPDDDYRFAAVAEVLRSTWFAPPWLAEADAQKPLETELLFRNLNESRGAEAYLTALQRWAETPPPPLEDESESDPRRQRKIAAAADCLPFARQFFALWSEVPKTAPASAWVDRLMRLARELGLADHQANLSRFWQTLRHAAARFSPKLSSRKNLSRAAFSRWLTQLVTTTREPLPDPAGRVRLRTPEEAVNLACDSLYVMNLGEGSFPQESQPPGFWTDAERESHANNGHPFARPSDRRGAEQLLFARLIARPTTSVVFSYPAVDDHGQTMLPSSFLEAVHEPFAPGAIDILEQRMLIEGFDTQTPYNLAELRVQVAHRLRRRTDAAWPSHVGDADLHANLTATRQVLTARFRTQDFGPFDGNLDHPAHPAIAASIRAQFHDQCLFSPTALEAYIECPFRFWLEHVLRLEPLAEPADDIEHTRRGAAVHRALAKFHGRHTAALPSELPIELQTELEADMMAAVGQYAERAASDAGRVLWELEGQRLVRQMRHYRRQWGEFRSAWQPKSAEPTPTYLEADFGVTPIGSAERKPSLDLVIGQSIIRIGGRIDRIDVSRLPDESLGYWIIDYKTGRGTNYSANDLLRFEKLQLPLYALAVERVLLKDQIARPLGLAYWMVTESGPKVVLPSSKKMLLDWFTDPTQWPKYREQLERWVAQIVASIRNSQFPLAPRSDECTSRCSFGPVCRITNSRDVGKVGRLPLPVVS